MIDGGLEYCRCSFHGDEEDLCLYDDESHEVQRNILSWGTYGKDGKSPLVYVQIKDMTTNHIEAVLAVFKPSEVLYNCMKEELRRRYL